MVDIASAAHRVMTGCIIGARSPVGCDADVWFQRIVFLQDRHGGSLTIGNINSSILRYPSSVEPVDEMIGTLHPSL